MHKSIIQLPHALHLHVFAKSDALIELTYIRNSSSLLVLCKFNYSKRCFHCVQSVAISYI